MNMKKISTMLAVLIIAISSEATIIVSNVVCYQEYPWNGKIDIEYEVFGSENATNIWVLASGYDNESGKSVQMRSLSGDGIDYPIKPGKHLMKWDAEKDMPGLESEGLSVSLRAFDAPLYMVVDLSGGVENITYRSLSSVSTAVPS